MDNKPQIVTVDPVGFHNKDIDNSINRLKKAGTYKDLSTIIVCPTRGYIHAKVVQSWMGMLRPMNQKVIGPLFAIGMEVGEAYNSMVSMILNNPDLKNWKYMLTIEEDNIPPPDGLLKLYEDMEYFDVVGGLYWTKGEGGQPMIYGDPAVFPRNYIPQVPKPDTLQPACGLGMGFNMFKIDMFKNIEQPWFKTLQEHDPNKGSALMTQDLYFYEKASKAGYKFACDTRVKVGHYDAENDIIW